MFSHRILSFWHSAKVDYNIVTIKRKHEFKLRSL